MNDLDAALRTMLQERAGDIATLPSEFTDLQCLSVTAGTDDANVVNLLDRRPVQEHRAPRRSSWLVAAAVAAVLAVGGTLLVLDEGSDARRTTPVQSTRTGPVQSTRPGPTVSSTPEPPAVRTTCTVGEPAAWRSAFARTNTYGAQAASVLTFAGPDLVVARDFGSSRDVALVSPNGSVRRVYSVPDPEKNQVLTAAGDGNRLLVPVFNAPRGAGVLPSIVRLDVVDLRTAAVTNVTTAPIVQTGDGQGRTIEAATIYRGTVYYNVLATYSSQSASIHAWDPTDRADRVVGTRRASHGDGPIVRAGGLYWSGRDTTASVAATLPAPVRRGLVTSRARSSLVTDGTSYAWSPSASELAFWAPGMAAASTFRTSGRSVFPSSVAGQVVIFTDVMGDSTEFALDTRGAAVTTIPSLGALSLGRDGVLVGHPGKLQTSVLRVDTATLPKLTC